MIDLFRPHMSAEAIAAAAEQLTPLADGRLFIGQGQKVEQFEKALQDAFQTERPPLTVNSCTSAIDLALHLCGVGRGDSAITTPMTCSATNTHIVLRGATPLWADVDPITGLIDPVSVAALLRTRHDECARLGYDDEPIRAVIAVDWGGRACDYNALRVVCESYNVPIIEDAAHAAMAQYKGRSIGYMGGDAICYSFQAIKHLTTIDGGALVLRGRLAGEYERAKLLRWYGLDRTKGDSFRCALDISEVGYKYHMHDVAAAIGLANLKDLPGIVWRHRQHALWYTTNLANIPGVTLPPWDAGSSWWLYTLLVPKRDEFIAFMAERGVMCSPVHARNDRHTGFGGPTAPGKLPGVDAFAAQEVAIPVGWWLSKDDLRTVANAVWAWSEQERGNGLSAVSHSTTARFASQAQEAIQEAKEVIA